MITINPSVFQLGGIDDRELGRSIYPSVDEATGSPITPVERTTVDRTDITVDSTIITSDQI